MSVSSIPEPTAVLHAEPDFAVGTCGAVFIVVWKVDTTAVAMRRVAELFRAADIPEHVGMLTIIDENATMPDSNARRHGAEFLARNGDRIVASAVVHEGSGFKAAAVRAVVTGLSLLARQSFPHRVFPAVQPAAKWLCNPRTASIELTDAALLRQCAALRLA